MGDARVPVVAMNDAGTGVVAWADGASAGGRVRTSPGSDEARDDGLGNLCPRRSPAGIAPTVITTARVRSFARERRTASCPATPTQRIPSPTRAEAWWGC